MKINDILILEVKNGKKKRKNGLRVMSLDAFLENSLNEAPIGLGAQTIPFPEDEMQDYLDRIKNKKKTKQDKFKKPYIHGSNIEIKDGSGEDYDTDSLRAAITTRPKTILKQNEKMQHSDGSKENFFNVGLPALKGLAVDEDTGEFVIVNTCPGAGECKLFCYAMKGGYIQFPGSSMFQSKVLNFMLNDPSGFEEQLSNEIAKQHAKYSKNGEHVTVRWHDAGDFFSPQYLAMAHRIAKRFPDVDFYAYTKVASNSLGDMPDNFRMNFSQGAQSKEERQIDFKKDKHSKVVPKNMFDDLIAKDGRKLIKDDKGRTQFKDAKSLNVFKKRMANHFKIDPKTILTYDEMMSRDLGKTPKWNIIVMPGDGDNSANNPGVLGSYLLFH